MRAGGPYENPAHRSPLESSGVYADQGIPALRDWLGNALLNPIQYLDRLIPDEQPLIEAPLTELADSQGCCLVLITGGTGPAARDVTLEATLAVAHKVLPGFGEAMRAVSLKRPHRHPLTPAGGDPRRLSDPQPAGSARPWCRPPARRR